jgi:hypothetical protein
VAATHGRGIWIMEDISPLQQMTPEVQQAEAHLFQSRPAIEWLSIQPQHNGGNLAFVGENPTRNAIINYRLSPSVTGNVAFEITDIGGTGTCTGSFPAAAGTHRVEWTMRWDPAAGGGPAGRGGAGAAGPGGGGDREEAAGADASALVVF